MINVRLISPNSEVLEGSLELIDDWKNNPDSSIWIDILQEPDQAETDLLSNFGCHELAIKDAHRHRHPPKIEFF